MDPVPGNGARPRGHLTASAVWHRYHLDARKSPDHRPTPADFLSTTFPKNHPSLLKQLQEATKYKTIIEEVAGKFEIQSCIIAGLGSRESHWGLALIPPGPEGTGDFVPRIRTKSFRTTALPPDGLGFGRGLLQIDYDYHEFARIGNWKDPQIGRASCR